MNIVTRTKHKKHTLYFLSFCLLLITLPGFASDRETVRHVTALTLEGMNYAYNFMLDSAETKFNEALALEPTHPRPLVGRATIVFWRFAFGNDENLYEQLLHQVDEAIDIAEEYRDENDKDADALTCLGSLYGYKAFAHARQRNYLKAAWDGKKSLDYFQDAVQMDPNAHDAYLGLGCYHYFASFAPKALQWVISILGVEGDANRGVKEIQRAIARGTYTATEAQYYLAQFLPWQGGDFTTSESLLVDLHKRFPRNFLISFTLSIWEMRRNDVNTAKDRLQEIVVNDHGEVPGLKALSLYKLGECHFRLNESRNAIKEYKAFLSLYQDEHYRATAHFRIGFSYEITGRREQALKHYQASRSEEHKHGDDRYSSRKAETFLNTPISTLDSLLFIAKNDFKSGKYESAISLYKRLDTLSGKETALYAEALYGIGEALVERQAYAEALPYFSSVVLLNPGDEQWLIPWAHYQLGFCHVNLGNKTVAKHEFNLVLQYDEEFDFKNWLKFRAERELEKIQ